MAKSTVTDQQIINHVAVNAAITTAEVAAALSMGHSTAGKRLAALIKSGDVIGTHRPGNPATYTVAPIHVEPEPPVKINASSGDRLAPGSLAVLICAHLAANPNTDFGPAGVGKALDRSSGACANALVKLAVAGHVVRTSVKPLRYRANATTFTYTAPARTSRTVTGKASQTPAGPPPQPTREGRLAAAKVEAEAVKAAAAKGEPRPATPNLDAVSSSKGRRAA